MDAKAIIERIKNPTLLEQDEASSFDQMLAQAPYFSVGHFLKYGSDYLHHQARLSDVAIHKHNPILFAGYMHTLQKLRAGELIIDIPKEEVIEEMPIKTTIDVLSEKLTPTSPPNIETKVEEVKEPVVQEIAPEPELKIRMEPPLETYEVKKPEIDLPLASQDPPLVATTITPEITPETEDVMQIINALDESSMLDIERNFKETAKAESPLPMSEVPIEVKVEIKQEPQIVTPPTQINDEEEKAKSLMVMMSFTDWLQHFKHKTEEDKAEEKEQKALKTAWQKEKLAAAADEEIDEIPEFIFKQAMDSISMESDLISESLAQILTKQGKHDKAIAMYKKLSLRNPEKSAYFANLIQELTLNYK